MSTNKPETIAAIVAEMRGFKRYATSDSGDCRYVAYWLYQTFADRLEAAHKREYGNGAKIREALAEIRDAAHVWISIGGISARRTIEMIFDVAKAALAAPPRNCDVGTVEEQAQRMAHFCKKLYSKAVPGRHICSACKFHNKDVGWDCYFGWAQMPYEEGGEE